MLVAGRAYAAGMQRGRVRRDRHGRGLRGPLAPPSSPLTVPRTDQFGELVARAVERVEPRWAPHLDAVEVEVTEAPSPDADADEVVLAEHRQGPGPRTVTLVLHRRPVELRAPERRARIDLVRDLVAEELAAALGLEPVDVDPSYDVDGDDG